MGTPSSKVVRSAPRMRVDNPDFQHVVRGGVQGDAGAASATWGTSAVMRGFLVSAADATTVRVTRGDGAFVVPVLGGSGSLFDPATVVDGVINFADGASAVDMPLGSFAQPRLLHVYLKASYASSDNADRVFGVPGDPPTEEVLPIDTRWQQTWSVVVALATDAQPANSVRAGSVYWDGALDGSKCYQSAQLLFEGCAVPDGTAAPFPGNDGPAFLPDFNRNEDRRAHGNQTFAQFARSVLKSIEEIKDGSRGGWWREPLVNLSLRSAAAWTFTIGNQEDDPTSGGNFLCANDGDITSALQAIATLAAGYPHATTVLIKSGSYKITANCTLPARLSGSGEFSTVIDTNGFSLVASSDLYTQITDLRFSTSSAVAPIVLGGYDALVERVRHVSSGSNPFFISQSATGGYQYSTTIRNCTSNGRLDILSDNPLRIVDSQVHSLTMQGHAGVCPALNVYGSTLGLLWLSTSYGDVVVESSTIAALLISRINGDVTLSAVRFAGDAGVNAWRARLVQGAYTVAAHVVFEGCTFVAGDGVSGIHLEIDAGNSTALEGLDVQGCLFVDDWGFPAWTGAGAAVRVDDGPYDWAVVRNCRVQDFAVSGFENVTVQNCEVQKTRAAALASAVCTTSRVSGLRVRSALTSCLYLMRDCSPMEDVDAQIPDSTGGQWEVAAGASIIGELRARAWRFAGALNCGWGTADANVDVQDVRAGGTLGFAVHPGTSVGRRAQFADLLVAGDLQLQVAGALGGIGAALSVARALATGRIEVSGQCESLLVDASVFENGALVVADASRVWATCEFRGSCFWPRGDASGVVPAAGNTMPTADRALVVDSGFADIRVLGCELRARLNDASVAGDYDAGVWLKGANRVLVEDCTLVFAGTADTAVADFMPVHLLGRELLARRNSLRLVNATGADVDIARLVRFTAYQPLGTGLGIKTSLRMRFDDNDVETQPDTHTLTVSGALIEYELPAGDDDESVFLSIGRNEIQMRSNGALIAKTVTPGAVGQAHIVGAAHGNMLRDTASVINAFTSGFFAVMKIGGVTPVFDDVANQIVP